MAKGKICTYCGDELVYDSELDRWTCEACEDMPFKEYSSRVFGRVKKTRPYQFFFGPKEFDYITRKASKRLWKGVKKTLLGFGLILAFWLYYDDSKSITCCLVWGLLMFFKKLKPPEDPDRSKGYKLSFHYLFPNYLVYLCIFVLSFLVIIDVYTLGKIDSGHILVDFLKDTVGMTSFLNNHPYLVPVILWYIANRAMIHAYREAFEAGHRISIRRHDAKILKKQKTDVWYKKLLLFFSRGIGYVSMFKTVIYTLIFVLIFIINVGLFHQGRREDFMYGLFSGYNIVLFQVCFLLIIFIAMTWVTDYIIQTKYPNTVFSRLGKISLKVKKTTVTAPAKKQKQTPKQVPLLESKTEKSKQPSKKKK